LGSICNIIELADELERRLQEGPSKHAHQLGIHLLPELQQDMEDVVRITKEEMDLPSVSF